MPNPDGSLNWNDPGFVSNHQNLGGNMAQAGEYLFGGAGTRDPTQSHNTTQEIINNMNAEPSDWQIQNAIQRDQGFNSGFLNSSAYNPGGANAYAISNSAGQNSGRLPYLNWGIGQGVPKSTWMTGGIVPGSAAATPANLAAQSAAPTSSVNTGNGYNGVVTTPATGSVNTANTTTTNTQNQAAIEAAARAAAQNQVNTNNNAPGSTTNPASAPPSTLQSNSIDLNKNRHDMFKRGNAAAYGNGAQYYQTASLPGGLTGAGAGSGYGGLGYSSANSGNGWGGGNNWNRAIWSK
jgi:hypothetical protein